MPQKTLVRKQAELDFDSGSAESFKLADSHAYVRLNVLVDYDVNIGTTNDDQNGAGILELIQDMRVIANNKNNIKRMGFPMSHYISTYKYAANPVYDTLDHTTSGDQTGQIQTFIDFVIAPGDYTTLFPSWETSDFEFEIQWGTDTDIADDATINSATAKVESEEITRENIPRNIVPNLGIFKEVEKTKPLSSQGSVEVDLPTGNTYYAIPFAVFDGDAPSNALVTDYEVEEEGVRTHRRQDFDQSRAQDKVQYGLTDSQLVNGFSIVNFGLDANLDHVVPTATMDQWDLNLNVGSNPSDPAEARVVTQELIL